MDAQNKKCADPILEKLGLGQFYHGDKPLVWIAPPTSGLPHHSPCLSLSGVHDWFASAIGTRAFLLRSAPMSLRDAHDQTAQLCQPTSGLPHHSPCLSLRATRSNLGEKELHDDVALYNAEESDLSRYFVKDGELGPYASLLYDKTFKKTFSPDTHRGKRNLLNLLNDMLEGQIPQKIKDVTSQQPELNDSGSKVSKSSILDLHCRDEHYNFIEIEIQIERETNFLKRLLFYSSQMIVQQGEPGPDWDYDVKPVYVISFARFRVFDDDRPLHRAGFLDYETANPLIDSANFTIVELSKVKKMIRKSDSEAAKWMFIFRYLHCLKELPPTLKTEKFEGLLPFAKLARFNKKELKRYRYIMHLKWDRYAQELAFAEDHPDFVNKIRQETLEAVRKILQKKNLSPDVIKECLEYSVSKG